MGAGEVHVLYLLFLISISSFNVLFVNFIFLFDIPFSVSICSLTSFCSGEVHGPGGEH